MKKPKLSITILLWILAIVITGFYVVYENDPYDPLNGTITLPGDLEVEYEFARSRVLGRDLNIAVDVPEDVAGYVEYRRVASDDEWDRMQMIRKMVRTGGHRGGETVEFLASSLPSLQKMAGKYEYLVYLERNGKVSRIDDGRGNPIVSRYRGDVPAWVLIPHIIFIMFSMLFAIRAGMEALRKNGRPVWMMWVTIVTLLLGGFIFGPLMQKYAFGVLWSGVPFGWDITDNKVVIELILWIVAAFFNTGSNKGGAWSKRTIAIAGIVTFLIYMIPHSLLGSAYDYTTGTGTGTSVQ